MTNHAAQALGANLPFRNYRFKYDDTIPVMAATIGKVVMVWWDEKRFGY